MWQRRATVPSKFGGQALPWQTVLGSALATAGTKDCVRCILYHFWPRAVGTLLIHRAQNRVGQVTSSGTTGLQGAVGPAGPCKEITRVDFFIEEMPPPMELAFGRDMCLYSTPHPSVLSHILDRYM